MIEVNELASSADDDKRIIGEDGISTKTIISIHWINITNSECNQEATLYPQELTSALLIQKLSQVHLTGNTSHDYWGLLQFLSIYVFLDHTLSVALCL